MAINFTFVEEKHIKGEKNVNKKKRHIASINLKHNILTLSMDYVNDKKLEGKFIKFFVDTDNKAIAWKIMKGIPLEYLEKNFRRIKVSRKTSKAGYSAVTCQFSLKSLISALNITTRSSFTKLPIQEYDYKKMYGDVLNYIELK